MAKIGNPTLMQVQDGIVWDFSGCPKLFFVEKCYIEVEDDWNALQDSCPEEISIVSYDEQSRNYIVQRLNKKLGTNLLIDAQKK